MKKIIVLVAAAIVLLVMAGCGTVPGTDISAGTYVVKSNSVTWTLVLADGSFDYKVEVGSEQTQGFKGGFDKLEDTGDGVYIATLTSLEEWSTGTTYEKVTIDGQTIKLTHYTDYPLDEIEAEAVSFYLDVNGDGSYANTGGNVSMLGMNLQP